MTDRIPSTPAGISAGSSSRTCRWIDGDVREPGWGYCDLPTIAGRSWCAEHNARAYHRGGANDGEGGAGSGLNATFSFAGRCGVAELLALKDGPDDVLLDQVEAIGERAARHMLTDEADRLQHTDLPAAKDCAALADRIDALIRPAGSSASAT